MTNKSNSRRDIKKTKKIKFKASKKRSYSIRNSSISDSYSYYSLSSDR